MKMFPVLLISALACGCATVKGFYDNPAPPPTPAQVAAAPACSVLPVTRSANINPGIGWVAVKMPSVKPPAGMELQECGNKYADGPFYHAKLSDGTAPLLWGRNLSPSVATQDVRFVFDLIKGSVRACGQYHTSFGVGSLQCAPKTYTVEGPKPIRVVLGVEEKGQRQPGAPVDLVLEAASDGVIVGQISTTQQMD